MTGRLDRYIKNLNQGDHITDRDVVRVIGLGCSAGSLRLAKVEYTFTDEEGNRFTYIHKADGRRDCEEHDP